MSTTTRKFELVGGREVRFREYLEYRDYSGLPVSSIIKDMIAGFVRPTGELDEFEAVIIQDAVDDSGDWCLSRIPGRYGSEQAAIGAIADRFDETRLTH